ncbi:mtDNA inheritance, partitioning of the mitochondrial organelle [Entomortierella beljakovae]|nr:mtDNA inheritance, partitioning of the mitochondrial organelle [Entomortierella beljakovae]
MHEIVTLQFGHYANFVGAHYWNTQDAHFNYEQSEEEEHPPELVNHDCLYRVGMTSKGVDTYTPRALIFDLKGGFGSINKYKLYEEPSRDQHEQQYDLSWDPSRTETFQEEQAPLSEYQQHLEKEEQGIATEVEEDDISMQDTRTWSDFSRVYFHPKSMVTASGYQINSEFMPFDVFSYGRNAFIDTEKEKDTYDENLRLFTEECDQLQGFQVLADIMDGWGGFATSYLEQLREDYPKSSIVVYGLSDSQMGKNSTLPLSRYHTSAFISAGIDSALLPGRLRRNSILLPDLIGSLNWRNITTIGTLSVGLPFPFGSSNPPSLIGKKSPLHDLSTLYEDNDDKIFSQSIVLRGLETNQFSRYTAGTQNTPSEFVDSLLDTLPIGKSLGDLRTITPLKYPIPTSYPHFFQNLNADGYQSIGTNLPNLREDGTCKVKSAPTITRLAVSSATRWHLQSLSDSTKRINWRLMSQFEGDGPGGVTGEEFSESKETLLDFFRTNLEI